MRTVMMLAAVALSPIVIQAQAITPAQSSTTTLQSKVVAPAGVFAELDRGTVAPVGRISTGVVPAKLIHSVDISTEANPNWLQAGKYRSAVVEMIVDEKGKPSELSISQSAGGDLDRDVLAAVSQYRFQPATVSSQPVAMPLSLTVNILNPLDK
jgi:TonB family protein